MMDTINPPKTEKNKEVYSAVDCKQQKTVEKAG